MQHCLMPFQRFRTMPGLAMGLQIGLDCAWDSFAPRRGSAPTARQTDLCWCVASLTHVRSPVASDCCAEKLIPHHVPFLRAGKTLSHGLRDQTSAEMAAAPVALERSR